MDIVLAAIAVAAFTATLLVFVGGALRPLRREPARTVGDAADGEWMGVPELAAQLEVSAGEVMALVERDAVPYYVIAGGDPSRPEDCRFRRDEIRAWIIG